MNTIIKIGIIYFAFWTGLCFEDFMNTNRTRRLLESILYLTCAVALSLCPHEENKKQHHTFDFEKENPE